MQTDRQCRATAAGEFMRANILALGTLLAFGIALAAAASYDGKWEAAGQGTTRSCPDFVAHIRVAGNKITIDIGSQYNSWTTNGTIAPDGSFTSASGASTANGKFLGDTVEFTLGSLCGPRTGKKVTAQANRLGEGFVVRRLRMEHASVFCYGEFLFRQLAALVPDLECPDASYDFPAIVQDIAPV